MAGPESMLAATCTVRTATHKKKSSAWEAWRLRHFSRTEANPMLSLGVDHSILYRHNARGIRR
jgi:hypothetical protein